MPRSRGTPWRARTGILSHLQRLFPRLTDRAALCPTLTLPCSFPHAVFPLTFQELRRTGHIRGARSPCLPGWRKAMKSYKQRALISAIILFCLGCLSTGTWLVFEGSPEGRNPKIETGRSKLENPSWRLAHQGFPTTSSSGLANLVADNVASRFRPSPPWGRGWTAAGTFPSRGGPGEGVHARARVVASYGRMPLSFEANAGQTDSRVKFLSRGAGYTLFLTGEEAVLALKKSEVRSQKREIRKSKSENRNSKIENRNPKIEIRKSKIEIRNSKIEARNSQRPLPFRGP